MSEAAGTFEVALSPLADERLGAVGIAVLTIDKTFDGGLVGTSVGQMMSASGGVEGSAGYVAIERFSGRLEGRRGTFVLMHEGMLSRGEPSLSVDVVPDSGTDELGGLSGSMTIDIVDGRHEYRFTYSL